MSNVYPVAVVGARVRASVPKHRRMGSGLSAFSLGVSPQPAKYGVPGKDELHTASARISRFSLSEFAHCEGINWMAALGYIAEESSISWEAPVGEDPRQAAAQSGGNRVLCQAWTGRTP